MTVPSGPPSPPSSPVPPFRTSVRSYELDALGHANHAVYLNWFEQARYDALEAAGLPPSELLQKGWGIHVVRIEVDYRAECRLGEAIRIDTGVDEIRNSSMTIRQILRRGNEEAPACEARVVAVWVGADGRPMRIPERIRSAFASWIPGTS